MAKKQNIYIGSREGNRRIERAIPRLMNEEGFAKRQATAVAIRLESVGRLRENGNPSKRPLVPTVKPIRGLPMVAAVVAQSKKNRQPKKTKNVTVEPVKSASTLNYQIGVRNKKKRRR
jgi:hypothetical protein